MFPSLEKSLEKVSNRYLLVVLAAKRARQLNRGAQNQVEARQHNKPTSVSLEEIAARQGRLPRQGRRHLAQGLSQRLHGPGRPRADPRRHREHRRLQGGLPAARAHASRRRRHRRDDGPLARVHRAADVADPLRAARARGSLRSADAGRRRARRRSPSAPTPSLVAPATANVLAKAAGGLADDFLSTLLLAARCPVLMAPAMDGGMWDHPAVRANVRSLRDRGVVVLEPDAGALASGLAGRGRLPEPEAIVEALMRLLAPVKRPVRRARARHFRAHARADRSRALHLEPVVRQDGPRHCHLGSAARRQGDARGRTDAAVASARRRVRARPDRRGDARGRAPAPPVGHHRDQGRRRRRLSRPASERDQDQVEEERGTRARAGAQPRHFEGDRRAQGRALRRGLRRRDRRRPRACHRQAPRQGRGYARGQRREQGRHRLRCGRQPGDPPRPVGRRRGPAQDEQARGGRRDPRPARWSCAPPTRRRRATGRPR